MGEAGSSLSVATARNVAWLGGTQAVRQVVSILTSLLLARFLLPTDYGVFAMTLFVNELAQLFVDFGIGSALIQRKVTDQRLLSTCFWVNVAIGLVAAVAVVASGPLASAYFKQPLIASLLLVSALNLCVSAVAVLPQALLARGLHFKHIAVGSMLGSVAGSATALVLAGHGFGAWSLAWQPLIGTFITFGYLAWRARWLPSLVFDLASIRDVAKFSGHLLGGNLVTHFSRNLHHLIVGPILGAAAIGSIAMAQTIAWLPIAQITSAAVKAVFPVFAQIQDSRDRMAAGMLRALEIVTMLTFPLLFGLAALADLVTPVVFGAQWTATSPLIAVFCIQSVLQCVSFIAGSTLLATGRSRVGLWLALIDALLVGAMMFWLRNTDALSVCMGLVLGNSVVLMLGFFIAVQNLQTPWRPIISTISRASISSGLTGIMLLVLKAQLDFIPAAWRLVLLIGLGAVICLGLTFLVNRRACHATWELIRESFVRK